MVILFLLFYVAAFVGVLIDTKGNIKAISVTPKEIYEANDLNMFTCIILSALWFLINPFHIIARFLLWITRVGRK